MSDLIVYNSLHVNTIFKDEELSKDSTVKFFSIVQKEGNREVERITKQLKLDIEKYNKQYHIGASLKDLGKKVFAFSKIDISIENITKGLK